MQKKEVRGRGKDRNKWEWIKIKNETRVLKKLERVSEILRVKKGRGNCVKKPTGQIERSTEIKKRLIEREREHCLLVE